MDKKNWYWGQRLGQQELDEAFDETEVSIRNIAKDLLGFGLVVSGTTPATVVESTVPDLKVKANTFLGYDQNGRRVSNEKSGFQGGVNLGLPAQNVNLAVDEVAASTAVATPGNEKTLTIFIEFDRWLRDPRTDDASATVYFDVDESIKFNVVQSAEAVIPNSVPAPARTDQLILADIKIVNGQTAILNTNIDQTRRQGFVLNLPHAASHTNGGADELNVAGLSGVLADPQTPTTHGSNHIEGGSDAIPNATAVNGGLLSAAGFVPLNAISFGTAAGIAGVLPNTSQTFQPGDFTAPSATTLNVTGLMAAKAAGGSSTKEGVATQSASPNNLVEIQDQNEDNILDGSGNRVFGRITVDNETTPTIWTLSFYSMLGGVETPFNMTPQAGNAFHWFVLEAKTLANKNTFDTIQSDQVAGTIPDGTTVLKGKLQLAIDDEVSATKALKANDPRIAYTFQPNYFQAELSVAPGYVAGTAVGSLIWGTSQLISGDITQDLANGKITIPNPDAVSRTYEININTTIEIGQNATPDARLQLRAPFSLDLTSGAVTNVVHQSRVSSQNNNGITNERDGLTINHLLVVPPGGIIINVMLEQFYTVAVITGHYSFINIQRVQ